MYMSFPKPAMYGSYPTLFVVGFTLLFGRIAANHCDTNGDWGSWGSCSKSCGGGYKSRVCRYDGRHDQERCNPVCYNSGEFYASRCHCVPGTTGPCCSDILECASNPCKNGGVCEEHVNYYRCNCPAGTSQPHCDDILECASNPCKNNGTCNEYISRYHCDCIVGTTGPNCDDILECASNPCLNGGTCVDLINHYKCMCVPGTTGVHCIDIPECASNPCQNGGTCNEMINGYNCSCPERYTGVHCEKDLLSQHDNACRQGGSCYFVFKVKDTWDGAKKFCEARRGHLAVPDDMAEQLFLETYLQSMRVRYPETLFWIGGKKSGLGLAFWVTSFSPKYSRWPQGVSDNVAGTQCLALDGRYNFMWEAFSCARPMYYICEEMTPFALGQALG